MVQNWELVLDCVQCRCLGVDGIRSRNRGQMPKRFPLCPLTTPLDSEPLRSVFRRNWPALSVPIFPHPALLKRVSPFILVRRAHLQRRDRAEQHARGGRRPPSLCRASASPNLRRAPLRVGRPYALSSLRRELQGASARPRVAASALALRRKSRGGGRRREARRQLPTPAAGTPPALAGAAPTLAPPAPRRRMGSRIGEGGRGRRAAGAVGVEGGGAPAGNVVPSRASAMGTELDGGPAARRLPLAAPSPASCAAPLPCPPPRRAPRRSSTGEPCGSSPASLGVDKIRCHGVDIQT